ncbi:MAG: DSD1 family PLP-dependent enzyme [Acidimicrobiia bacterium]|nr:DSD1 family PLP-dependent enzyme [Acidimicrobiia bacterium]
MTRSGLPSPGQAEADLDTPALVVDLDALERNLDRMASAARAAGVALRPHVKTHKSVTIAHMQLERGAVGVCVQTVSEAEAMVEGGIRDVVVANEVVGTGKLRRLASLAQKATITVCVDDAGNLDDLGRAVRRAGSSVGVMVEMNTAEYRAGVPPGELFLQLAQRVDSTSSLRFVGIQAYNGVAQHIRDHPSRQAATERNTALVKESVDMLARHGIRCEVVTGGGTGTYDLEAASEVYNEIQPGTYVFMDADYLANRDRLGGPFRDFEVSLHVLATVMSRRPNIAIVDAGLKAVSLGNGLPMVKGGRASYERFADEHGVLAPVEGPLPALGHQVRLIPVNCDPTVNLYDHIICLRNGGVEGVWPVDARGY